MFLRRSIVRRAGKTHTCWRLVRSVRRGKRVRQETVAMLGELDAEGRAKASALARHFLGVKANQRPLFEDEPKPSLATVRADKVRFERQRAFGDVWLGHLLWQALELDAFCARKLPPHRERVPWVDVIEILVLARLCEPSSELHIAEDWYQSTALDDLLGVAPDLVHHMRLYRGMDHLLRHKDALQVHLKERLGSLFELEYDLMLYDVTSTYFEGRAERIPSAKRGHSRDGRSDCKQVCIGLVVSREGFPVGYEVFAGNRTDVTTVEQIVETMESRYGKAQRVWVMDRGMTSEANLEWLRRGGRKYLVGTPKSGLRKFERQLVETAGWTRIRDGLEVRLCASPEGQETFILCRSTERGKKESAIYDRFRQHIVDGLASLTRRVARSQRPLASGPIERQIGRLLQSNQRAASSFDIRVEQDAAQPSGLRISWSEIKKSAAWARLSQGAYVLRSNVTDWSADELWRTYIQLTEAEAAFRIQKSDLRIRPIWHQREDRVHGHILICFIAYAMWKLLEGWCKRARVGSSARRVLEEMKRISSADIVLPLEQGPDLRLRCVLHPSEEQAALLDRLGVRIPKRLVPNPRLAGM